MENNTVMQRIRYFQPKYYAQILICEKGHPLKTGDHATPGLRHWKISFQKAAQVKNKTAQVKFIIKRGRDVLYDQAYYSDEIESDT